MKRLLIILGILVTLGSCSPEFYCKHCPTRTTVTTDTVHTVDTIEVEKRIVIHAETVTLHDYIPCPDYNKTEKGKRGTVKVVIKDHKLTAECICDSIEVKYKQLTILDKLRINRNEVTVKEKSVPRKLSWWNKTMVILGYIFSLEILLALAYGVYRLLKSLRIIK
jgi:hypothetical protein